jgi:two-component system, NarL family, response regulator DesR
MSTKEPITAIVADDHPALLVAVIDVLTDAGITVIGIAPNGEEALEQIETLQPRVALLDMQMPRLTGIEVARRAATSAPATRLLLYAAAGDRVLVTEAFGVGIRGFVLKEAPLQELVRAVGLVASGGTYVDPALAGAGGTEKLTALTQRERDVLRLLSEGLSNEQIGTQLSISPQTVRTHIKHAMGKLGAGTRTHAVAIALRRSLIR